MAKVSFVRPSPASNGEPLWGGGPPPADDFWCFLGDFIRDLGRLMSLSDTMEKHSIDAVQWEFLVSRSPWFVNAVNQVMEVKRMDALLVARQRAIGHKMTDGDGQIVTDADGVPIRKGFDPGMAKFFIEMDERAAYLPAVGDSSNGLGPLLPSNIDAHRQLQIDDCRLALDALRPAVRAGDRQAIDSFTKVQDRLAKLSGTDAPKQSVTYVGGSDAMGRLSDEQLEAIAHRGLDLVQGPDGTYGAEE